MHRAGVEEQRIAGRQMIRPLSVPVNDFTGEHVDELDAGVAERRVGHGILLQRDQKRLDDDVAAERVTEKLIYVPGLGAAPALGQDTDSILLSLQSLAPSGRG